MIPQNTSILTKEMKNKLDIEQTAIQKELEMYNSWFIDFQFQFLNAIDKLKLLSK